VSASPLASQSLQAYPRAYSSALHIFIAPTLRVATGQEDPLSIFNGGTVTVNGVTLVMRNISLRLYTILIGLKFMNGNSMTSICDVAIDAYAYANTDSHSIVIIGSGEGLYWYTSTYSICVITSSNYPLPTGLSTYWYGSQSSRTAKRWNQGCSTVSDYGMAMSWQNVPASG
jgi:hypothetical protein